MSLETTTMKILSGYDILPSYQNLYLGPVEDVRVTGLDATSRHETVRSRYEELVGSVRVHRGPHRTGRCDLPCSTVTGIPRLRRSSVVHSRHFRTTRSGGSDESSGPSGGVSPSRWSVSGVILLRVVFVSSLRWDLLGVNSLRITSVLPPQWNFWDLDISMVVRRSKTLSTSVLWGGELSTTHLTPDVSVSSPRRTPEPPTSYASVCSNKKSKYWLKKRDNPKLNEPSSMGRKEWINKIKVYPYGEETDRVVT